MTANDLGQSQPVYVRAPRPAHDGMAIAAFVTCWFVPLVGIIFGHISNHKAKVRAAPRTG
jgi:hypothetical protein